MISLILYGRNDNYGYNLHKRAALSLNCMAEVLSGTDDEIIFVDYNTPDDFPTFPEAIQDTLTDKAKRLLRVLRVRPVVHARFHSRSHLLALEPVARNVALRRSNPANRWVLSTNTDMIFVPRRPGEELTGIATELPDGYWGAPRFELPETLWESLDRRDAAGIIAQINRWGWDYHLNEIVYGGDFIRFDGPGDFQLMPRAALFALHGFHEGMLVGWHVDSNIAKRMQLHYGEIGDLSDRIFAYHCDHTRQVTPAHKREAVENSSEEFVSYVQRPELPEQSESWGCPDDPIEEIRLSRSASVGYVAALQGLLAKRPLAAPLSAFYTPESWSRVGYRPEHVLPFLLDLFASMPRGTRIGWIGLHAQMFALFRDAWRATDGSTPILVPQDRENMVRPDGEAEDVQSIPFDSLVTEADALIFDFIGADGMPLLFERDGETLGTEWLLCEAFRTATLAEWVRQESGAPPRRFVGINAIHNGFEQIFNETVAIARTPFSVRLRHGFVLPRSSAEQSSDWLALMIAGPAGERCGRTIAARDETAGCVAYGPYVYLSPSSYCLKVTFKFGNLRRFAKADQAVSDLSLRFRLAFSTKVVLGDNFVRKVKLWGRRVLGDLAAAKLKRIMLAAIGMTRDATASEEQPLVVLEIGCEDTLLVSHSLSGADLIDRTISLHFNVPPKLIHSLTRAGLELRVISNGFARFHIIAATAIPHHKSALEAPAA